MIESKKLSKKFRTYKKEPGISGAFKNFFSREYIDKYALFEFDFKIKPGEFVGLLGPNGAGKTTLMKMMTGIINPSYGELSVLGYTPHERKIEFRKKIALVMGQKSQLWWDIPAMDSLLLLQKYYEISDENFKQKVEELSELLGVKEILHIHVRKLSLGERMKLELMSCLLHEPDVIFLDEPTIGLDLIAQKNIRTFLKNYQQKTGCTVILTSHYMADVEALCQRIILVIDGKKHFDGPIENFQNLLGNEKHVRFSFSESINPEDSLWAPYDAQWSTDNKQVDLRVKEDELRKLGQKVLCDYPVAEFNTEKMPIERVMTEIMDKPQLAGIN